MDDDDIELDEMENTQHAGKGEDELRGKERDGQTSDKAMVRITANDINIIH